MRVIDGSGKVVSGRTHPRSAFKGLRRRLYWDTLDFIYFYENRYLRRLDYTAEVIGGWAHAAHLCGSYRNFNGFKIATRGRVRPLFFGSKPSATPTLAALDIHDIRPLSGQNKFCRFSKIMRN